MQESLIEGNIACKDICMITLLEHSGFLHEVSTTLMYKTDPSCPTKCKDYWTDTLKNKAPIGLEV